MAFGRILLAEEAVIFSGLLVMEMVVYGNFQTFVDFEKVVSCKDSVRIFEASIKVSLQSLFRFKEAELAIEDSLRQWDIVRQDVFFF